MKNVILGLFLFAGYAVSLDSNWCVDAEKRIVKEVNDRWYAVCETAANENEVSLKLCSKVHTIYAETYKK